MSEFDNNGFESAPAMDTVEDPQVIDNTGADEAGQADTTETADTTDSTYTTDSTPDYGTAQSYDYSSNVQYGEPEQESKVFAIISLVCGIVSLVCSCCGWLSIILGVAGVVLGIVSINKQENARGMAIAGIICGGLGTLIAIVIVIMGSAFSAMDESNINQMVEQLENL
ncbi:MAG: DUF4190 domain-containing protein [Lachnospiraceae bacterium]|nr:DUF4190 domain-containing protein [Lachnospiraceae bacterium]